MNPYVNIFNVPYIQQQAQQQYHKSQMEEVNKCVKALHDFFDGIDKIEPSYQKMASVEFSAIVFEYLHKHGIV